METTNTYTVIALESPTHHPYNMTHHPDVLDIVLANLPHHEHIISNHNDLSSDYNPQILSISDTPTSQGPLKNKQEN